MNNIFHNYKNRSTIRDYKSLPCNILTSDSINENIIYDSSLSTGIIPKGSNDPITLYLQLYPVNILTNDTYYLYYRFYFDYEGIEYLLYTDASSYTLTLTIGNITGYTTVTTQKLNHWQLIDNNNQLINFILSTNYNISYSTSLIPKINKNTNVSFSKANNKINYSYLQKLINTLYIDEDRILENTVDYNDVVFVKENNEGSRAILDFKGLLSLEGPSFTGGELIKTNVDLTDIVLDTVNTYSYINDSLQDIIVYTNNILHNNTIVGQQQVFYVTYRGETDRYIFYLYPVNNITSSLTTKYKIYCKYIFENIGSIKDIYITDKNVNETNNIIRNLFYTKGSFITNTNYNYNASNNLDLSIELFQTKNLNISPILENIVNMNAVQKFSMQTCMFNHLSDVSDNLDNVTYLDMNVYVVNLERYFMFVVLYDSSGEYYYNLTDYSKKYTNKPFTRRATDKYIYFDNITNNYYQQDALYMFKKEIGKILDVDSEINPFNMGDTSQNILYDIYIVDPNTMKDDLITFNIYLPYTKFTRPGTRLYTDKFGLGNRNYTGLKKTNTYYNGSLLAKGTNNLNNLTFDYTDYNSNEQLPTDSAYSNLYPSQISNYTKMIYDPNLNKLVNSVTFHTSQVRCSKTEVTILIGLGSSGFNQYEYWKGYFYLTQYEINDNKRYNFTPLIADVRYKLKNDKFFVQNLDKITTSTNDRIISDTTVDNVNSIYNKFKSLITDENASTINNNINTLELPLFVGKLESYNKYNALDKYDNSFNQIFDKFKNIIANNTYKHDIKLEFNFSQNNNSIIEYSNISSFINNSYNNSSTYEQLDYVYSTDKSLFITSTLANGDFIGTIPFTGTIVDNSNGIVQISDITNNIIISKRTPSAFTNIYKVASNNNAYCILKYPPKVFGTYHQYLVTFGIDSSGGTISTQEFIDNSNILFKIRDVFSTDNSFLAVADFVNTLGEQYSKIFVWGGPVNSRYSIYGSNFNTPVTIKNKKIIYVASTSQAYCILYEDKTVDLLGIIPLLYNSQYDIIKGLTNIKKVFSTNNNFYFINTNNEYISYRTDNLINYIPDIKNVYTSLDNIIFCTNTTTYLYNDLSISAIQEFNNTTFKSCIPLKNSFLLINNEGQIFKNITLDTTNKANNWITEYINYTNLVNIKKKVYTLNAYAILLSNGVVYTFGEKTYGGDGCVYSKNGQIKIRDIRDELYDILDVVASDGAFAAFRADGRIITWGLEHYGGRFIQYDDDLVIADNIRGGLYYTIMNKVDYNGESIVYNELQPPSIIKSIHQLTPDGSFNIVYIVSNQYGFACLDNNGKPFVWGGENGIGKANDIKELLNDMRFDNIHNLSYNILDKIYGGFAFTLSYNTPIINFAIIGLGLSANEGYNKLQIFNNRLISILGRVFNTNKNYSVIQKKNTYPSLSKFSQNQTYYFDLLVRIVNSPSINGNTTLKLCIISDNNRVISDNLINKLLKSKISNVTSFNYFINVNELLMTFTINSNNTVSVSLTNRVFYKNIITTTDNDSIYNISRVSFYKSLIVTNNYIMYICP